MKGAPQTVLFTTVGSGNPSGLIMWSYGPRYFDSSHLMSVHFLKTAAYSRYESDPTLEQMAVDAISAPDRQKAYSDIQTYAITDQAVWVPMYTLQNVYGVSKNLKWSPRPDQYLTMELASLH